MLAAIEGFSIWDLLDTEGKSAAASITLLPQRFHYSLEPAKIMCGWMAQSEFWDFGVSSVGNSQRKCRVSIHCYTCRPSSSRRKYRCTLNIYVLAPVYGWCDHHKASIGGFRILAPKAFSNVPFASQLKSQAPPSAQRYHEALARILANVTGGKGTARRIWKKCKE